MASDGAFLTQAPGRASPVQGAGFLRGVVSQRSGPQVAISNASFLFLLVVSFSYSSVCAVIHVVAIAVSSFWIVLLQLFSGYCTFILTTTG